MSTITYTLNIGDREHNQLKKWQVSPTILRESERYAKIETVVGFNPFTYVEIPDFHLDDRPKRNLSIQETKIEYPSRIVLPTAEGIHLIEVSKIIRLEADKNYTMVYIDGQSPILISKTLKEVEKQLNPESFFRIHQSHTVDINKIDIYHRGRGGSVTLRNGDLLPVSKNKKESLLDALFL